MRSISTFLTLVLMILCLATNGAYAQDLGDSTSSESVSAPQLDPASLVTQERPDAAVDSKPAPAASNGLFRFVAGVVSIGALVASVVTSSPTDPLKFIAVSIGADQVRK